MVILQELRDANACVECRGATSAYLVQFTGGVGWNAVCSGCAKAIKASGRGRVSLRPPQF
jgi:hypothetical protein